MPVSAEIGIHEDLQTLGLFGIQNKSVAFGLCKEFHQMFDRSSMRHSWVLGKLRAMVSGVRNVGARALLNKVEFLNCSKVVEVAIKIGSRGIASKDLHCECWRLSCCHLQRKAGLIVDGLCDLRLRELDSPIWKVLNVDPEVVLYVYHVFNA